MSLEAELIKLTAATEKQNSLLERLLAASTGTAAKTEDKASEPKASGKGAKPAAEKAPADKPAADTPTTDELDAKLRPWLGEFPKGHPETEARRAKFKEVLGKLGETKLGEITDAKKLVKLDNWFETKAKTWDEGHGIGRLAADPEEASGSDADEDDL